MKLDVPGLAFVANLLEGQEEFCTIFVAVTIRAFGELRLGVLFIDTLIVFLDLIQILLNLSIKAFEIEIVITIGLQSCRLITLNALLAEELFIAVLQLLIVNLQQIFFFIMMLEDLLQVYRLFFVFFFVVALTEEYANNF